MLCCWYILNTLFMGFFACVSVLLGFVALGLFFILCPALHSREGLVHLKGQRLWNSLRVVCALQGSRDKPLLVTVSGARQVSLRGFFYSVRGKYQLAHHALLAFHLPAARKAKRVSSDCKDEFMGDQFWSSCSGQVVPNSKPLH